MTADPRKIITQRQFERWQKQLNNKQHYLTSSITTAVNCVALVSFIREVAVWAWPQGWCNKTLAVRWFQGGNTSWLTGICCWSQAQVVFLCNTTGIYQQRAGTCGNVTVTPDPLKEDRKTHVSPRGSGFLVLLGTHRNLLPAKRKFKKLKLWLRCRWRRKYWLKSSNLIKASLSDEGKVETGQQPQLWWDWNTWLRRSGLRHLHFHRYGAKTDGPSWIRNENRNLCLILVCDTMETAARPAGEWHQWSMWHVGRPPNWKCWCQGRSFLLSPLTLGTLCWLFTFRGEVDQTNIPPVNPFDPNGACFKGQTWQ